MAVGVLCDVFVELAFHCLSHAKIDAVRVDGYDRHQQMEHRAGCVADVQCLPVTLLTVLHALDDWHGTPFF